LNKVEDEVLVRRRLIFQASTDHHLLIAALIDSTFFQQP
jgi:hypothetical protein